MTVGRVELLLRISGQDTGTKHAKAAASVVDQLADKFAWANVKANLMTQVMQRMVGGFLDGARSGAALEAALKRAFGSADEAERISAALGGLLSQRELAAGIERLQSAGINAELTTGQIRKLLFEARKLGLEGGEAFERFGKAVLEGTTDQLKDGGLVIDQTRALEAYAQKIGTTAGALTEAQRSQAVFNATIAELDSVTAGAAGELDKIDQAFNRLEDAWGNVERKVLAPLAVAAADILNLFFGGDAQDEAIIQISQSWQQALGEVQKYEEQLRKISEEHKELPRVLLEEEAKLLELAGRGAEASQKRFEASLVNTDLARAKVQAELDAIDATLKAQAAAHKSAQAAVQAFNDKIAENEARISELQGQVEDRMRRGLANSSFTETLRQEIGDLAKQNEFLNKEREAGAGRVASAEGQVTTQTKEQLSLQERLNQLERERGAMLQNRVVGAHREGLRLQAEYSRRLAQLMVSEGKRGAALRSVQRAQFGAEKDIALLEVKADRAHLENEAKVLEAMSEQLHVATQIAALQGAFLAPLITSATDKALADLKSAIATAKAFEEALKSQTFKAPRLDAGEDKKDEDVEADSFFELLFPSADVSAAEEAWDRFFENRRETVEAERELMRQYTADLLGQSTQAFTAIARAGNPAVEALAAVAGGAMEIARNYQAIKAGAPGAIAAIGATAAASISNEKARAAVMGALVLADAVRQTILTGNFAWIGLGLFAAGLYGVSAAVSTSSAKGAKGTQATARPSAPRIGQQENGGTTHYHLHGLFAGTLHELGGRVGEVTQIARGSGMDQARV